MEHRICRFCESSDSTSHLFQYAVRSYAHWTCFFKRKSLEDGLVWLRGLPSWKLRNVPVLIVQDWLDMRGWTGDRAMELLLGIVKDASYREAKRET